MQRSSMRVASRIAVSPSYLECYAAQIGALGACGQKHLRRSRVLIAGAGGVGSTVAMVLAMSGVGALIVVDPQRIETDNFNRGAFLRRRDIGRSKVDVLAAALDGRPYLSVIPIVRRIESIKNAAVLDDVDLFIATANSVRARVAVASFAVQRQVPQVSAALTDARTAFGGLVVAWTPQRRDLACPACLLAPNAQLPRGESILAAVAAAVGSIAAHCATRLLTLDRHGIQSPANIVSIDLGRHSMESLKIFRRTDCPACGEENRTWR